MQKRILVDISCGWLQAIRLVHAISESRHKVVIPSAHLEKFQALREKFGMRFEVGTDADFRLSDLARISHADPITAFGSLHRNLVFPMSMLDECRNLWQKKREYRFSFAGLITSERQVSIDYWSRKNFGEGIPKNSQKSLFSFLPPFIHRRLIWNFSKKTMIGGQLLLWTSNRGRIFPGKSWDQNYFELLGNTSFALCPKGDCIWSYRFFEAVLCGAIPIIEESCPVTDGFIVVQMEENVSKLEWNAKSAEHNFNLLREKFTLQPQDVDIEIERLAAINKI